MPWLLFLGTGVLATFTGFISFSQGSLWRSPAGQIFAGLMSISCFMLIAFGFWRFGILVGLGQILVVFGSSNIGVWLLQQLGGKVLLTEVRPIDPQRLADEIWSEESSQKRDNEDEQTERIILAALSDFSVQQALIDTGLNETHLRDIYRRLRIDTDIRRASEALRCPELIRFYAANGGGQMKLSLDAALEFTFFARYGHWH